jgi:hypothetical protein
VETTRAGERRGKLHIFEGEGEKMVIQQEGASRDKKPLAHPETRAAAALDLGLLFGASLSGAAYESVFAQPQQPPVPPAPPAAAPPGACGLSKAASSTGARGGCQYRGVATRAM